MRGCEQRRTDASHPCLETWIGNAVTEGGREAYGLLALWDVCCKASSMVGECLLKEEDAAIGSYE